MIKRLATLLLAAVASVALANGQVGQSALILTVGASSGPGTPLMFQHIATSTNPAGNGITGRTFIIQLGNSSDSIPAKSTAVVGVTALSSIATVSISDTLVGAWSAAACTSTGGAGNFKMWVFVQPLGSSSGADTITINTGATSTQPVQVVSTVYQNLATTSPADGCLSSTSGGIQANSSGLIAPGSFTPTTNNNANGGHVIWNYVAICGNAGSNSSKWVPASGYTLLSGEVIWVNNQGFPDAVQQSVQTTNASTTPSITATGEIATGDCFNSTSVALKVANNGSTAPSFIRVAKIFHESFFGVTAPVSQVIQMPTVGNLRVLTMSWNGGSPGGGTQTISGIVSTDGCTWHQLNAGGGSATMWYAQNCSPDPVGTTTITYTGTGTMPQASFRGYDLVNAQTSSFQSSTGNFGACGTTNTSFVSITPTVTGGITMSTIGNGNGPITAITAPTGASFDLWLFTGISDSDVADNADYSGHYNFFTNATQNWSFTKTNGSDSCYTELAVFQ